MMVLVPEEINRAAWNIVRGYFASGLTEQYRNKLIARTANFKRNNPHHSVEEFRELYLEKFFNDYLSYEDFLQLHKNGLLEIAASQGIGEMEMYHLYNVSVLDYVLVKEYPDLQSFGDSKYTDEELLNFAYKFAIGLFLTTDKFTSVQTAVFMSIVANERENGLSNEDILQLIIDWVNLDIDFEYFRDNPEDLLEAFDSSGLTEGEAFKYYKILFSHTLYKLVADRLLSLKHKDS